MENRGGPLAPGELLRLLVNGVDHRSGDVWSEPVEGAHGDNGANDQELIHDFKGWMKSEGNAGCSNILLDREEDMAANLSGKVISVNEPEKRFLCSQRDELERLPRPKSLISTKKYHLWICRYATV